MVVSTKINNSKEQDEEESLLFKDTFRNSPTVATQKNVQIILTVREAFSFLFMRGVSVNPLKSFTLFKHKGQNYIVSTECLSQQTYFKNRKIKTIRRFSGQLLAGVSVANPINKELICPIVLDNTIHNPSSSGLFPVCPLLYQHDLHLSFTYPLDRKSVFDKFGRTTYKPGSQFTLKGNSNDMIGIKFWIEIYLK